MSDSNTKERLDELEDLVSSGRYCTEAETWVIAIAAVLLFAIVVVIAVAWCWDTICEQIAINILEQLAGPLPPPR